MSIEEQWKQYLQLAGLKEELMGNVQRQETKRAFYGACGQMMVLMRDEISEETIEDGAEILQNLLSEVQAFWIGEMGPG